MTTMKTQKFEYTGPPPFADAEWAGKPGALCLWCAGTGHPHGNPVYGICECPPVKGEGSAVKMWYADSENWEVEEVECPNGLHPADDAKGRTIYSNTHYATRVEAVDNLRRESEAWISMAARRIQRAKDEMGEAEADAAMACVAADKVANLSEKG